MRTVFFMALIMSCLSLATLNGIALATTEQDVATMQHPNGPQHENVHCRICR